MQKVNETANAKRDSIFILRYLHLQFELHAAAVAVRGGLLAKRARNERQIGEIH